MIPLEKFEKELEIAGQYMQEKLSLFLSNLDKTGGLLDKSDATLTYILSNYENMLSLLDESGYSESVKKLVGTEPDVVKDVLKQLHENGVQTVSDFASKQKDILNSIANTHLEEFAHIGEDSVNSIRQLMTTSIMAGTTERELAQAIADSIDAKFVRYAKTYAVTSRTIYYQYIEDSIIPDEEKAKVVYEYVGAWDDKNRPECRFGKERKYFTAKQRAEFEAEYGKFKYNCRHTFMAVPEETAKADGLDKKAKGIITQEQPVKAKLTTEPASAEPQKTTTKPTAVKGQVVDYGKIGINDYVLNPHLTKYNFDADNLNEITYETADGTIISREHLQGCFRLSQGNYKEAGFVFDEKGQLLTDYIQGTTGSTPIPYRWKKVSAKQLHSDLHTHPCYQVSEKYYGVLAKKGGEFYKLRFDGGNTHSSSDWLIALKYEQTSKVTASLNGKDLLFGEVSVTDVNKLINIPDDVLTQITGHKRTKANGYQELLHYFGKGEHSDIYKTKLIAHLAEWTKKTNHGIYTIEYARERYRVFSFMVNENNQRVADLLKGHGVEYKTTYFKDFIKE